MKRITIICSAVVLIGIVAFMCSCANIETGRFAVLNREEGSMYFNVSGFNSSPLTSEGPFPRWSNDLKVALAPGVDIPTSGKREFRVGQDCTARYNAVETGTIVVDQDRRQVDVNVKYVESYWWNRAKGRFPITKDE